MLERNSERCNTGHADGLVSRSLEILDSFGIAEKIYKDAYREIEMCSWVCETAQNGLTLWTDINDADTRRVGGHHTKSAHRHFQGRNKQIPGL